ncbi:S-adenosylmethionine_synthetase [Hexamita inflata]|uniref:S-adenosylmethionine synthetase n=1 Tax=Hexamita inflata TaxID=28002 RepID=A0AA86UIM1_9EUKA|nr:S-adenosylmethionine synthetase [Hexamita inflata]
MTIHEYEIIVRNTLKRVGFDDAEHSIDYRTCKIHDLIDQQSPDIAQAVHVNKSDEEIGAGDQGLMSGYATNETRSMMPSSFQLAKGQLAIGVSDQWWEQLYNFDDIS